MPLKLLPHKSFHVYNSENIARVQRDEARAREEQEELDRRSGIADSEARLGRMRATTSLLTGDDRSGLGKRKRKRGEDDEAEKKLDRQLKGKDREVDAEAGPSRAGTGVTGGHLNFWAEFEAGAKPTSAEHPERKLERALEKQQGDDLTKVYLAKKGEGDMKGWYASEDGKTEKERKETDETRLERAYKDGENKRLTDPLALMQSYLKRRTEVLHASSTASSLSSSSRFRTPATPNTDRDDLSPVITRLLAPKRRRGDPIPARPPPPAPPQVPASHLSTTSSSSRPLDPASEARDRVSSERARAAALIAARKRAAEGGSSVASTPRSEYGAQGFGMFNRQETRDARESWAGGTGSGERRGWGEQKRRRDERHEKGWNRGETGRRR